MAKFILPDKKFKGVVAGRLFEGGVSVEEVPEAHVEQVARILCRYHGATVEGTDMEVALASPHIEKVAPPEKKAPEPPKDEKKPQDGAPKAPVSL